MIQKCAACGRTGLNVESRIVADESPLGYHREPRCVDETACEERQPHAINEHERSCPDCQRVIREERAAQL